MYGWSKVFRKIIPIFQLNAAGQPKSETQIKLEKIKEKKKMMEDAEKEKYEKSIGDIFKPLIIDEL